MEFDFERRAAIAELLAQADPPELPRRGHRVRVDGKPEPLIEIATVSAPELARLAWHIGNRHTEVQVVGDRLRIRHDHVLVDMLRGLGATLTRLDAPFDPEAGAYHDEHGGHEHHT